MKFTFDFYKVQGTWFIDLPHWEGDQADLAMVLGADTLLDQISKNGTHVKLHFSDAEIEGAETLDVDKDLTLIDESLRETAHGMGGAFYIYNETLSVWLCDVTKFVFGGYMPEKIWFKNAFVAPVFRSINDDNFGHAQRL